MKNKQDRATLMSLYVKIKTNGLDLVNRFKSLIVDANNHRLVVKKSDGYKLVEIPFVPAILTSAVVVLFAPILAALGVIAVLVGQVDACVERYPEPAYAVVAISETTIESLPKS